LQAALEGKTSKIYDSYYAGFVPHRWHWRDVLL
jgi:hypothetical protein